MNTEAALRNMFADAADAAPEPVELLDAVRGRSRHQQRRRIGVAAAITAIVLAGAAILVPRLIALAATDPTSQIMPSISFPYTPGWAPGRYVTRLDLPATSTGDQLVFYPRDKHQPTVTVTVTTTKPAVTGNPVSTTVQGRPATVVSVPMGGGVPPGSLVFWSPAPGHWVSLLAATAVDTATITGYADHLRAEPIAAAGFVAISGLPAGTHLDSQSPIELNISADTDSATGPAGGADVTVVSDSTRVGRVDDTTMHETTWVFRAADGRNVEIFVYGTLYQKLDLPALARRIHVSRAGAPVPGS